MTAVIIGVYVLIGYLICRHIRAGESPAEMPDDDSDDDYEIFTTSEQARFVAEQMQQLEYLEQLLTDIESASPDLVRVVQLSWMAADGTRTHDLYLHGDDAATEWMLQIIRREIHDQRSRCALHAQALAARTRRVRNGVKNDG